MRGRKNLTLNEQLTKITTEIEKMESSLKEMKKAKKELEEQIRQARLSELDELIQEKGLTFDELKEMLIKKDSEQSIDYSSILFKYKINIVKIS